MNINYRIKTLATAIALAMLSLTGTALADHSHGVNQASASSVSGYANGRNTRAQYDYVRVISSEPIIRYVTVSTPVRQCWQDVEYYTVNHRATGTGGSALMGAIVGGVIGHQFGSGRGNDVATVAGALIGAAIGNGSAHDHHGYRQTRHSRPVQRCETEIRQQREQRIDGYRVTYRYNGQRYVTRMPYDPGRELRVRIDIRPAG